MINRIARVFGRKPLVDALLSFVSERNAIQGNPRQTTLVGPEEKHIRVSGEYTIFLDTQTLVEVEPSTKVSHILNNWVEAYFVALTILEDTLPPQNIVALKNELEERFDALDLEEFEKLINKDEHGTV